jgi:predicted nucleic acid-binding protein
MEIAIDTSVLIGLLDAQDVWHSPAGRLQEAISSGSLEPVYFDCVLAEAISTLSRRLREKHRETEFPSLVDRLLADFSPEVITWLLPDVPRLYRPVMELIQSSAGELNFNDGLIALACRERNIRLLASFDGDFDTVSWLVRVATPADVRAVLARPPESTPDADAPGPH